MATATVDREIIAPQPGKQSRFVSCSADFCFYGGARGGGKTAGEILDTLRYIGNPKYRAVIFRETSPQIRKAGGLLDATRRMYPKVGGKLNVTELSWTFPSGARVELAHLQHDKDVTNWQGLEITGIYFDEVTHFSETRFWGVAESNRSTSGIKPYVRGTCNPDASSFVAELISWWIDPQTGLPIAERDGVIRHFMRRGDDFEWFDEPQYNDKGRKLTKSLTFISATIYDNPILMKANPDYLQVLENLPEYRRQVMLHGNWLAVDDSDTEWPSTYFERIWMDRDDYENERYKNGGHRVRVLSLDPSKGKSDKRGDFSAFVFLDLGAQRHYCEAELVRLPPDKIVTKMFDLCEEWKPDVIVIEGNQFQDLLANLIIAEADNHKGSYLRKWIDVNEFTIIEHKDNKLFRLRKWLSGPLGDKDIRFVRGRHGTKMLVTQLREFPKSIRHPGQFFDDGPDALAQAFEGATKALGFA